MAREIIIDAKREGYSTDQVTSTMTVGELIEILQEFDEDTPVYIGHDRSTRGWYTYGGVREWGIELREDVDEEEEAY